MIMFFLPWWTYVLVFTVAWAGAFGAVWLANIAEPGIRQDDGPFPCLARADNELWCWLDHGHEGPHDAPVTKDPVEWPVPEWVAEGGCCENHCNDGVLRQSDAAGNVVVDENPGYLPDSAPPLPQRMGNRPWPGCPDEIQDGKCRLVKSHIGPHEYI